MWMSQFSFFGCALEALSANEMNGLWLREHKDNLKIDIDFPGATVLTEFGFDPLSYWRDSIRLAWMFLFFLAFAFVWLQLFVRETK